MSYELVPCIIKKYNNNNINIGNLFVLMRFLLIDIWLLNLLKYLNIIENVQYATRIDFIYKYIYILKNKLKPSFVDTYKGINYDEKIDQKIIISKNHIKKTSYFPEMSINKTKKYKVVATSS